MGKDGPGGGGGSLRSVEQRQDTGLIADRPAGHAGPIGNGGRLNDQSSRADGRGQPSSLSLRGPAGRSPGSGNALWSRRKRYVQSGSFGRVFSTGKTTLPGF